MNASRDGCVAHAHRAIGAGSRSFSAAARLLPRECRESAVLLYAWCRHCDDAIDGQRLGHDAAPVDDARERLARLRQRTEDVLRGSTADDPAFEGLGRVVRRHDIPADWPRALLDGFALDVEGTACATLGDTLRYAYHVAGVVGLMMARVLGVTRESTLDHACDLGIAFQLTNVARDVDEDARLGRVYLPLDWLADAGLDRADVGRPERAADVHRLRCRLLVAAEPYYESAAAGIAELPFRSAWAIAAARDVYRDIGRVVRAGTVPPATNDTGGATVATAGRAYVARGRRWQLLAASCAAAAAPRFGGPRAPASRSGLWSRPS